MASDYESGRADGRRLLKRGVIPSVFSHRPAKKIASRSSRLTDPCQQGDNFSQVDEDHCYSKSKSTVPSLNAGWLRMKCG